MGTRSQTYRTFKHSAWLCLFFIGMAHTVRAQQTYSYTQYMDNLAPINAAAALLTDEGSLHVGVRKQWLGIPGAPVSALFNINVPLRQPNTASGVILRNDAFSVENVIEVNSFYAKAINLDDEHKLAVAINGGLRYYSTQYAQLDPLDPIAQTDVHQIAPNIGFGVMYFTDSYYVGVSVPQLTITSLGGGLVDNNKLRNHYFLTGGFTKILNEDFKIKPSTLVSVSRGIPAIADISAMMYAKDTFGAGITYRTNNEAAAMFSFDFDDYRFGYSYQFGTSSTNIGGISNATHEVSFIIRFGVDNRTPIHPGGY